MLERFVDGSNHHCGMFESLVEGSNHDYELSMNGPNPDCERFDCWRIGLNRNFVRCGRCPTRIGYCR
jgi:hypothetical protein